MSRAEPVKPAAPKPVELMRQAVADLIEAATGVKPEPEQQAEPKPELKAEPASAPEPEPKPEPKPAFAGPPVTSVVIRSADNRPVPPVPTLQTDVEEPAAPVMVIPAPGRKKQTAPATPPVQPTPAAARPVPAQALKPVAPAKAPEPPAPVAPAKPSEPVSLVRAPKPVSLTRPPTPATPVKSSQPVSLVRAPKPVSLTKAPKPVSLTKVPKRVVHVAPAAPVATAVPSRPIVEPLTVGPVTILQDSTGPLGPGLLPVVPRPRPAEPEKMRAAVILVATAVLATLGWVGVYLLAFGTNDASAQQASNSSVPVGVTPGGSEEVVIPAEDGPKLSTAAKARAAVKKLPSSEVSQEQKRIALLKYADAIGLDLSNTASPTTAARSACRMLGTGTEPEDLVKGVAKGGKISRPKARGFLLGATKLYCPKESKPFLAPPTKG
jgi:hypothetical protein